MRRDWAVIPGETGGEPGDQEAGSRAMALANRFDGPTIEKIHDALTALDFVGGQLYIQAYRTKWDADGNQIPEDEQNSTPGQWHTEAFVFSYETRPAHVKQLEPTEAPLEKIDTKARPVPVEEPGTIEDLVEEAVA